MHICLFEDSRFDNFFPLVYLRPLFSLRSGTMSLGEKAVGHVRPRSVSVLLRDDISPLYAAEPAAWPQHSFGKVDCWYLNARVVADKSLLKLLRATPDRSRILMSGENVAAAFIRRPDAPLAQRYMQPGNIDRKIADHFPAGDFSGRVAEYPWNLVHWNADEIGRDFTHMKRRAGGRGNARVYKGAHLLRRQNIVMGKGTVIKPGAVLDAEGGPIVIGRDVTVMPNAYIEGPAFIGDRCIVKVGAKIYHGTSIGESSKVGGEVEASIIQSHSNKQHDGFLGHSYLGSWVNLGADTNTSDLKNTYGAVSVQLEDRTINTGLQFVGLTIGDHSKTGINVMFDTGSVVGVCSNIFGAGLPPKFVPSFAWGGGGEFVTYRLDQALETARRVMARRDVAMSGVYEERLRRLFELTRPARLSAGVK